MCEREWDCVRFGWCSILFLAPISFRPPLPHAPIFKCNYCKQCTLNYYCVSLFFPVRKLFAHIKEGREKWMKQLKQHNTSTKVEMIIIRKNRTVIYLRLHLYSSTACVYMCAAFTNSTSLYIGWFFFSCHLKTTTVHHFLSLSPFNTYTHAPHAMISGKNGEKINATWVGN